MSDDHGNTPAAWAAVGVAMLGFVVAGIGLMFNPISLPVFIAVTEAGTVLDKTLFDMPVAFINNVDNARAASKAWRGERPRAD